MNLKKNWIPLGYHGNSSALRFETISKGIDRWNLVMKPLRSVLTRGQRYKGHVSSSRYGLAVNVEGCTHKGTCVSRGGRPIRTAATLSDGDVLEHYHGITSTYHASWFYSKTSPYESWQLELISDAFKCSDTTRNAQLKVGEGLEFRTLPCGCSRLYNSSS